MCACQSPIAPRGLAVVRELEKEFRCRRCMRSRVLVVKSAVSVPKTSVQGSVSTVEGGRCADGKTRQARARGGEQFQQKAGAGVGRSGSGSANPLHLHLHDDEDMA